MRNADQFSSHPAPRTKRVGCRRLVFLVVCVFVGLPVAFVACLGVFALFITTDEERAHELWEKGQKDEAVEIYVTQIETSRFFGSLTVKRAAEYYYESGNTERTKQFLNIAIQNGVAVSLEPKELSNLYQELRKQHVAVQEMEEGQHESKVKAVKNKARKRFLTRVRERIFGGRRAKEQETPGAFDWNRLRKELIKEGVTSEATGRTKSELERLYFGKAGVKFDRNKWSDKDNQPKWLSFNPKSKTKTRVYWVHDQ